MSCSWTVDEREALLKYKVYSNRLNGLLRGRRPLPDELKRQSALLDSAICGCVQPEPLTLYRAGCWTHENLHAGDEFEDLAYTSTSRDEQLIRIHYPGVNEEPNPARMIVDCPARSRLADVELVRGSGGDENEIILPRSSKFRILSVERITDPIRIQSFVGLAPWLQYRHMYNIHLVFLGSSVCPTA